MTGDERLRPAWFLATLGVLGGLAAIVSGYTFAREPGGIVPGAGFPAGAGRMMFRNDPADGAQP